MGCCVKKKLTCSSQLHHGVLDLATVLIASIALYNIQTERVESPSTEHAFLVKLRTNVPIVLRRGGGWGGEGGLTGALATDVQRVVWKCLRIMI